LKHQQQRSSAFVNIYMLSIRSSCCNRRCGERRQWQTYRSIVRRSFSGRLPIINPNAHTSTAYVRMKIYRRRGWIYYRTQARADVKEMPNVVASLCDIHLALVMTHENFTAVNCWTVLWDAV